MSQWPSPGTTVDSFDPPTADTTPSGAAIQTIRHITNFSRT